MISDFVVSVQSLASRRFTLSAGGACIRVLQMSLREF